MYILCSCFKVVRDYGAVLPYTTGGRFLRNELNIDKHAPRHSFYLQKTCTRIAVMDIPPRGISMRGRSGHCEPPDSSSQAMALFLMVPIAIDCYSKKSNLSLKTAVHAAEKALFSMSKYFTTGRHCTTQTYTTPYDTVVQVAPNGTGGGSKATLAYVRRSHSGLQVRHRFTTTDFNKTTPMTTPIFSPLFDTGQGLPQCFECKIQYLHEDHINGTHS